MERFEARALEANWINGWLAALGVALLLPSVRLRWSDHPMPRAIFESQSPLVPTLEEVFPTPEEIAALSNARTLPGTDGEVARNVTVVQFAARSRVARRTGDAGLSSTVTDLHNVESEGCDHSPFDPPAPAGHTVWTRLVACRRALVVTEASLNDSLTGVGRRVKANGLGFDHRRLLPASDPRGDNWVDPVVEVLAFCGLTMLPIRGDGVRSHARGWTGRPTVVGSFRWPIWTDPLTAPAIDALLDLYWSGRWDPPGAYESVPYQSRGSSDVTRAYAARRV